MSFKNYWTDLLEIMRQSVKLYTHCVCEIAQRSELNCMFEDQKIEITYQNYSSLNTWATLMKKNRIIASMSSKKRMFLDMSRTPNLLEK